MRVKLTFQGRDIFGLMTTNDQMVDPFHPIAKEIDRLMKENKAPKKTEARQWEIYKNQFFGALYINDIDGPYLKTASLMACLVEGAKIARKGKQLSMAVSPIDATVPLIYKGPRTKDELWEDGGFHDIRPAGKADKKIMVCHPHFRPWAVEFEVELDTIALSIDELRDAAVTAGKYMGLGSMRKIGYGRFIATVEALEADPNSRQPRKKSKKNEEVKDGELEV